MTCVSYRVILLDPEKCSGCGNCLTTCPANDLMEKRSESPLACIFKVKDGKCFLERACQHCTDAPCVEKCPEKLLTRDEQNLVTLNIDYEELDQAEAIEILKKCNDCAEKPCIEACPFHNLIIVPVLVEGDLFNIPLKCDQCKGIPSCVKVCGPGALTYADISIKHEAKERFALLLLKSTKMGSDISNAPT